MLEKPAIPNLPIAEIESQMLRGELGGMEFQRMEDQCSLTHRFAPGVYMREVFIPAGLMVLGHEHKTEHLNIVLSGRASVIIDGEPIEVFAPCTFVSKAGVRKALFIHEDCRWTTIHPTDETEIEKLEEMLIVKSEAFLLAQDAEKLKQLAEGVKP